MESVIYYIKDAISKVASDIFIGAGRIIAYRIKGLITYIDADKLSMEYSELLIKELYTLANRDYSIVTKTGNDDFSISIVGVTRLRVNTYKQRGSVAAVIRIVSYGVPDYRQLNIPENIISIYKEKHGLVLVTGPAGCGKSTTLACLINAINNSRQSHIITLEDPIEFLYKDNLSLISQREISTDSDSYLKALRACMRQSPDIILLGEMRDYETIKIAMTAAETGHLVISTLHTVSASSTVDRIIDVFPHEQQHQIRTQLSSVLRVVVSQRLMKSKSGGLIPSFEVMYNNSAIKNCIREGKIHQINTVIQTFKHEGMICMDNYIYSLLMKEYICEETALNSATDIEYMKRIIMGI